MNPKKPLQLTEEDIIRLARTMNQPLPEGYEAEVFAKIEGIERQRQANPAAGPKNGPDMEPDADAEHGVEP